MIETEILDVKWIQMEVRSDVVFFLQKDVRKCCNEAETEPDMALFLNSNSLGKTVRRKKKQQKIYVQQSLIENEKSLNLTWMQCLYTVQSWYVESSCTKCNQFCQSLGYCGKLLVCIGWYDVVFEWSLCRTHEDKNKQRDLISRCCFWMESRLDKSM